MKPASLVAGRPASITSQEQDLPARKSGLAPLLAVLLALTSLAWAQGVPAEWPHPSQLDPAPVEYEPPEPRQEMLSNGIPVFLLEDSTLPLVQGVVYLDAPSVYDPEGQTGLAAMTATMLREGGAGELAPDELDIALESLAASVEASANATLASVSFNTLSDTLPEVMELWGDVLLDPNFDQGRLEVAKQRQVEAIRRVVDNPVDLAFREFLSLLSGEHPAGDYPTEESVGSIERADIEEYYGNYYGPSNASIAVTGDFDSDEMLETLESLLGDWEHEVSEPPDLPPYPDAQAGIYLLPRPISQSVIMAGHPAVRAYTPAYNTLDVVNHILGAGGFTSRLFEEIRTRRGLAYSTGSTLTQGFDWPGALVAYSISPGQATGQVLELLTGELRSLQEEGVTDEELERAREAVLNSSLFRFASAAQVNERQARVQLLGLDDDYYQRYLTNLQELTVEEAQEVTAEEIRPDDLLILVVGNPEQFDMPLETFGEVQVIELE